MAARMRIRTLLPLLSLAFALVVAPSSAFATKTIGLSSGSFKFDVAAGDVAAGEVFVMNDGTEDIRVFVYAADQVVDAKGNITYTAPSRADLSALDKPSSWTQIKMPENSKSLGNIPYLELKPKARIPVKFSFTVPPNVPPGDHNLLIFFEMFEPAAPGTGAQSQVSGRIGTRITLRVKGEVVDKLEIRPFQVPAFVIGGQVPFTYLIRNLGNVDQRLTSTVLLLDRSGNEVRSATPLDARLVFAGTNFEANGKFVLEKQPFGPHSVRVEVVQVDDEGKALALGKDAITQSRTVWVIPMWLVIGVGLVVLIVLGRIVWGAAVKAAVRRHRKGSAVSDAGAGAIKAAGPSERTSHSREHRHSRSERNAEAEARRIARERRRLESAGDAGTPGDEYARGADEDAAAAVHEVPDPLRAIEDSLNDDE